MRGARAEAPRNRRRPPSHCPLPGTVAAFTRPRRAASSQADRGLVADSPRVLRGEVWCRGQFLSACSGMLGGMNAEELPPPLVIADRGAWRAWLDAHEYTSDGVWLLLAKKGKGSPTALTYQEALQEALCSGWVDGQRRTYDERSFRQRFTPRRARSIWSQRNVEIVGHLAEAGRMRRRGREEIEKARADGRWDRAYAGPAAAVVPADLLAALDGSPAAQAQFAQLTRTARYSALHPILTAATAQTRARRIAVLVARLERE